MSGNSFVFPPPPPPPPPSSSALQDYAPQYPSSNRGSRGGRGYRNDRGSSRGRGGGRGRGRGSGRGSNFTPLGQDWGSSQGHGSQEASSHPDDSLGSQGINGAGQHIGQKRDFAQAFVSQKKTPMKVAVAPAVPSFGAPLPTVLTSPTYSREGKAINKAAREKKNLLGLTPASADHHSSSEEDPDEEVKLAESLGAGGAATAIQFSHKGRELNLKSPAEIAAWIEERRRRYPTKARVEEAQRKQAEKKAHRDAERASRAKDTQTKRPQPHSHTKGEESQVEGKHSSRNEDMKSERKRSKKEIKPKMAKAPEEPQDDAAKARLRAARLQVELLKAQQELAALEAQELASTEQRVRNSQTTGNTGATIAHPSNLDDELRPDGSDYTSSDLSESGGSQDDNTSSEDSSSDDSDAAPFEVSAKEPVIEQVVEENPQPRSRRICRDFEKRGRCKFGNRCRYTHEKPVRDAVAKKPKQEAQSNKRVSLYQRLLKQQEEEENKRVLENITHLGDNGLLDEPDVGNSSATLNGPSS